MMPRLNMHYDFMYVCIYILCTMKRLKQTIKLNLLCIHISQEATGLAIGCHDNVTEWGCHDK